MRLNNSLLNNRVTIPSTASLFDLAYQRYGDGKLWREIADANEDFDLFEVYEGEITLNLPTREEIQKKLSDKVKGKAPKKVSDKINWLL